MVNILLKNGTDKQYAVLRDLICSHLIGNPTVTNNDIVVSDANEDDNIIMISLGSDDTPLIELNGNIDDIEIFESGESI